MRVVERLKRRTKSWQQEILRNEAEVLWPEPSKGLTQPIGQHESHRRLESLSTDHFQVSAGNVLKSSLSFGVLKGARTWPGNGLRLELVPPLGLARDDSVQRFSGAKRKVNFTHEYQYVW